MSSPRGVCATEEENPTQTTEQAESLHRYACLLPSQCQHPASPWPMTEIPPGRTHWDHVLWGTDQLHYFCSLVEGGRPGSVLAALCLFRWWCFHVTNGLSRFTGGQGPHGSRCPHSDPVLPLCATAEFAQHAHRNRKICSAPMQRQGWRTRDG